MGKGLDDLAVSTEAARISDEVWSCILTWDRLPREVVGVQLAQAADSIGANIAEAFGRFHYADKIRHLYYARGSLYETRFWLNRAKSRGLMTQPDVDDLQNRLAHLARQLNAFVASLRTQSHEDNPRNVRDRPSGAYTLSGTDLVESVPSSEGIETEDPSSKGSISNL